MPAAIMDRNNGGVGVVQPVEAVDFVRPSVRFFLNPIITNMHLPSWERRTNGPTHWPLVVLVLDVAVGGACSKVVYDLALEQLERGMRKTESMENKASVFKAMSTHSLARNLARHNRSYSGSFISLSRSICNFHVGKKSGRTFSLSGSREARASSSDRDPTGEQGSEAGK